MIKTFLPILLLLLAGCSATPRISAIHRGEGERVAAKVSWSEHEFRDFFFVGMGPEVTDVTLEPSEEGEGFVVSARNREGKVASLEIELSEYGFFIPAWNRECLDGFALFMFEGELVRFLSNDEFLRWQRGLSGWWDRTDEKKVEVRRAG